MKIARLMMGAAVLALASPAVAGGEGWTSDFEAAKKQAAESGKDLLVDFTGSDWCSWCIKLNREVFQKDEFKAGVKDTFVLVEIDFPSDKSKLSEETQKQNRELGETYEVRGYPTILLCDAQGRPFGKTGYLRGGPEPYLAHLNKMREGRVARDKAFAAAQEASGAEKAKLLVKGLDAIQLEDGVKAKFYDAVMQEILKADPEDQSGFGKRLAQQKRLAEFEKELRSMDGRRDMRKALALTEKALEEGGFDALGTQRLTMIKAVILANMQRLAESLVQIDAALDAAPDSPENERIRQLRAKIEEAKKKKDSEQE